MFCRYVHTCRDNRTCTHINMYKKHSYMVCPVIRPEAGFTTQAYLTFYLSSEQTSIIEKLPSKKQKRMLSVASPRSVVLYPDTPPPSRDTWLISRGGRKKRMSVIISRILSTNVVVCIQNITRKKRPLPNILFF